MRRSLFLLLTVIVISSVAWCKNIVVGSIQYLGTNAQGVSAFKVVLNTTGITESPITFDNMTLAEQGSKQSTGSITTPVEVLFGWQQPANAGLPVQNRASRALAQRR